MKWNDWRQKKVLPLLVACVSLFHADRLLATSAGDGIVTLKGSIVERPCAIDVGDRDQTLYMDTIPLSQIMRDGVGPSKQFYIRLVDCTLKRINPEDPDWQAFTITFNGEDDHGYFAMSGDARGVALSISDTSGNRAKPGEVMLPSAIFPGDMLLRYNVNLVGNREVLRSGNYHSSIRFTMNYY